MSIRNSSPWRAILSKTEIELKFDKISKLEDGWRYGEGKAPASENIERARRFSKLLEEHGLTDKDIFPGVQGDLTLELYINDRTLEITFENDGTVSYGLTENDEYILEKSESGERPAVITLMKILDQKCKLLDSYTLANTASTKEDLHQSPSKISEKVFQLSDAIA